jgi:hypothetical protein
LKKLKDLVAEFFSKFDGTYNESDMTNLKAYIVELATNGFDFHFKDGLNKQETLEFNIDLFFKDNHNLLVYSYPEVTEEKQANFNAKMEESQTNLLQFLMLLKNFELYVTPLVQDWPRLSTTFWQFWMLNTSLSNKMQRDSMTSSSDQR